MLTGSAYRKQLRIDLDRWVERGLLTRASAEAMLADTRVAAGHGLMTAVAFVIVILLAAGLIALVAANWQDIPREIRVAGLLFINLAVLAACLVASLRAGALSLATEASAALSVLAAAASISLIGQIYHFPANWAGFGLAMVVIAGATALVTRSAACVWFTAAAAIMYRAAAIEAESGWLGPSDAFSVGPVWLTHDWIAAAAAVFLVVLVVTGWAARAGAWALLITLYPLFWVLGGYGFLPWAVGLPLVGLVGGIVAAEILRREAALRPGIGSFVPAERLDAAVSAMLGLVVIACVLLSLQAFELRGGLLLPHLGVSLLTCGLAVAMAGALAALATLRPYGDRAALYWLAAVLAAPFLGELVLAAVGDGAPPLSRTSGPPTVSLVRLIALVVLPLILIAIEARLSERRKTFAAAIAALIAVIAYQLWATTDLLTFAAVMLASGTAALAALILARLLPSLRARRASGPGEA